MKTSFYIMLAAVNLIIIQSCHSQNSINPTYLGVKPGDFDLDKVTFKEDVNLLFSKVKYIKLPRMATYLDKKIKQEIKDTLAFEYKVDKPDRNSVNAYFLVKSLKNDMVFFFVDKSNHLKAVSFFMSQNHDFNQQIEQIDEKYKRYKVKLKPNKVVSFFQGKSYQWETPDKIISMTISTKPTSGGEYTCGLTVADKNTDFTKFPINRFIFGNKLCLDNSCKNQ